MPIPTFPAQPTDQPAVEGQRCQFTTTVDTDPAEPITASRWEFLTPVRGAAWTPVVMGADYSEDAIGNFYRLTVNPSMAINRHRFHLVATNTIGDATSRYATLTVRPAVAPVPVPAPVPAPVPPAPPAVVPPAPPAPALAPPAPAPAPLRIHWLWLVWPVAMIAFFLIGLLLWPFAIKGLTGLNAFIARQTAAVATTATQSVTPTPVQSGQAPPVSVEPVQAPFDPTTIIDESACNDYAGRIGEIRQDHWVEGPDGQYHCQ